MTVETKDHVATSVPDVFTTYSYDHTQQTGKSVVTDGVPTSNQLFEYDLQGRMASVTNQTLDSGGNVVGVQTTEYEYDTAGNRVVATNTVDADNDGTPESVTRTEYLTDANNPTGYSQVIEETEFDDQGNPTKKVVYTIGHDQISQTVFTHDGTNWDSGETHHFGYDGHGSVRVLYDAMAAMVTSATNNILQLFHFDAHGNLLNMQAVSALTSYLYSGEAFDSNIGQQYLRARWYDSTTGRFNRLDPFFGNLSDPQSLHKYLYVHGDPVNGVDPSGEFVIGALAGFAIGKVLRRLDTKRALFGYLAAGAAIDVLLLEATRNLFLAMGLSASPARRLTPDEVTVLTYLHENVGHSHSDSPRIREELSRVELYRSADIGIGDWTSVWGAFTGVAMARDFGAVTQREKIFFNSQVYNVSEEWLPKPGVPIGLGILAHETTHTLQAANTAGGLFGFGPYYLWENRKGYRGAFPEIEGYAMQYAVEDLMGAHRDIVKQIIAGTSPATAVADLKAFYLKRKAEQEARHGQ